MWATVAAVPTALPPNPNILKTKSPHVFRIINISQVCNPGRLHEVPNTSHVESSKLVLLVDNVESVSVRHSLIFISGKADFRQDFGGFGHGYRVVGPYGGTAFHQGGNDIQRRGFAHIICLRLKGKAKDRHGFALKFA